jgi:hypothetical protein
MLNQVPRLVLFLLTGFFFLCLTAGPLHATKAIANWDVVPGQIIDKPFKCGVVAFHETGVDVEFKINGTDAGRVKDPTLNDQTRVFEYWIEIDPAKYPDGPITVSATAIPDGPGHESRVLEDLILHANSKGTIGSSSVVWVDAKNGNDDNGKGTEAEPYATIRQGLANVGDGGTVYLKAGRDYLLTAIGGKAFEYWTTVSAAPGLKADDVHILTYGKEDTSTGRYSKSRVRWKNVSLFRDGNPGFGTLMYFNKGDLTWFDGAVLYDKNGRLAGGSLFNGAGARSFLTDTLIRDFMNAGGGFQRNVVMEEIGSDIYRGSTNLTAINVTIHRIDRGDTEAHPDFIQFYNPKTLVENVILYNVKAYNMNAQGIFGAQGDVADVAIVNLLLEKDPTESSFLSQLSGKMDHVLIWNATLVDQTFNFRDSAQLSQFDVRNGVFHRLAADNYEHESIKVSHCHAKGMVWNQKELMGDQATTGDPLFVDEEKDDYRLSPKSPAFQTGILCPGVPADIDGFLYDAAKPNRGAFAESNTMSPPTTSSFR